MMVMVDRPMLIFLLTITQETIPGFVSMWMLNLSSYHKLNLVESKMRNWMVLKIEKMSAKRENILSFNLYLFYQNTYGSHFREFQNGASLLFIHHTGELPES